MSRATILVFSVLAAPAYADGGAQVSEPSTLALMAMGVLGVIVGRRFANRRQPED